MLLCLLFYFIHDLEEILTVETFLFNHSDTNSFRLTTRQFTFAFLLLWIISVIGCYQALKKKVFLGMEPLTFFSILVPGLFLANGVSHFNQFIIIKNYVPGIITSILVIYPYSFFYSYILVQREINNDEKIYVVSMFSFYFTNSFCTFIPLVFRIIVLIYGYFTLKRVIHLNLQRKHSLDFYLRFRVM
ncbi:HXXEE domain-containing protein [Peribacillus sp. NPDC096379]|uniref:HXXEE domain-containing protein n=1 Tax=Peribacillus sp. NPDC096379 TaxID=3364393 RepID=UPI003814A952